VSTGLQARAFAPVDVLLDRDGVLIAERSGYVLHPDQVRLLPGAGQAVRRLCDAGCRVFVVTNQSPVGRGLISLDTLRAIHRRLAELIAAHGGQITRFFVCPHRPDEGCACRKPAPGLLYAAQDMEGVDLAQAVVVGDQVSDVHAARSAGSHGVLVRNPSRADQLVPPDVLLVDDVAAAADHVLCVARDTAAPGRLHRVERRPLFAEV
jgi:histidinol-phosphate phosphatase family protein